MLWNPSAPNMTSTHTFGVKAYLVKNPWLTVSSISRFSRCRCVKRRKKCLRLSSRCLFAWLEEQRSNMSTVSRTILAGLWNHRLTAPVTSNLRQKPDHTTLLWFRWLLTMTVLRLLLGTPTACLRTHSKTNSSVEFDLLCKCCSKTHINNILISPPSFTSIPCCCSDKSPYSTAVLFICLFWLSVYSVV